MSIQIMTLFKYFSYNQTLIAFYTYFPVSVHPQNDPNKFPLNKGLRMEIGFSNREKKSVKDESKTAKMNF